MAAQVNNYFRASVWYRWLFTFENVAEALIIHFGRAVEDVAALSETGGKVFRCLCFTRASWTGRGTPHLQMQRLYILIDQGKTCECSRVTGPGTQYFSHIVNGES